MDDQNLNQDPSRFEETPKKEGSFSGVFKMLGSYLKDVFLNFIQSFKYNDMKLAAILAAIPGFGLGFFLYFHASVVNVITFKIVGQKANYGLPFDWSAMVLFFMMLFGILNIFGAVSMSSKKNLGSVITTTITSAGIVICGTLYLVALFVFLQGVNSGNIKINSFKGIDSNWIISIASTIVSMVLAIAGVILGFIKYDRTYEKVDR